MTIALTLRSAKGSNLFASEVDANFQALADAIQALIDSPPTPFQISSVDVVDGQLIVRRSDGTNFGPFVLPVAALNPRGPWIPATDYETNDMFIATYQGRAGFYIVRQDHTSAATFDPDTGGTAGPYARLLIPFPVPTLGFFYPGQPGLGIAASQAMHSHLAKWSFYIPANFAGSGAKLKTAPDATLVFEVTKNDDVIGAYTFAAGETAGTFEMSSGLDAVQFDDGDILDILRPASLDALATDLRTTLVVIAGEIPSEVSESSS